MIVTGKYREISPKSCGRRAGMVGKEKGHLSFYSDSGVQHIPYIQLRCISSARKLLCSDVEVAWTAV